MALLVSGQISTVFCCVRKLRWVLRFGGVRDLSLSDDRRVYAYPHAARSVP